MKIESRYLDGSYLSSNPDWDRQDAAWKASQVESILHRNRIAPRSICEVGCGSGDILRNLRVHYPDAALSGYDISPQLATFWSSEASDPADISFVLGDFNEMDSEHFDVLLMLDVFEHVRDPFTFLEKIRGRASKFVFHIPLDLSASSVIRSKPLMGVRRGVGHLHFYTKDLALETLRDCGFRVIEWSYTGAAFGPGAASLRTRLAALPRKVAYALNKDLGVRVLGGETLIVLAE